MDKDNNGKNDKECSDNSIVTEFDKVCLEWGDQDAIEIWFDGDDGANANEDNNASPPTSICYFEIQEYSKNLACQLVWRFGYPDYVLVDCQGWPACEAIATLACMRINRPFVPVSCLEMHQSDRMKSIIQMLVRYGKRYEREIDVDSATNTKSRDHENPSIVAITACDNDLDPILSVFQNANIHRILYLNKMTGALQEQLNVPDHLPTIKADENDDTSSNSSKLNDDLYVLFTSGTSSSNPKAVIGSHQATFRRLTWFRKTFNFSPRIGRRTNLTFVDGVTELWQSLLDSRSTLVSVAPPNRLKVKGIGILLQPPIDCSQILLLPSQLRQLLLLPTVPSLERVIVSGEPCLPNLLYDFIAKYPKAQLINLYGQTETTGDVTYAILTDLLNSSDADDNGAIVNNVVAVGRPISPLTTIRLREPENQLILSGDQLSNGYLGATAKFDSFETGDTGFFKDGFWYVQGRCNDVIKIDGKWTSPSEIETVFSKVYQPRTLIAAAFVDGQAYIVCEDPQICQRFTRESFFSMAGVPWNLVPHAVICHEIHATIGGAGKVNRKAANAIARSYHDNPSSFNNESLGSTMNPTSNDDSTENCFFRTCVMKALGMSTAEEKSELLDTTKSFVELGGDSGKSITLLYLLHQHGVNHITATDVIMSDSLQELDNLVSHPEECKKSSKRLRRTTEDIQITSTPFEPSPAIVSPGKVQKCFELQACVDASPLIVDNLVYAACQGGVILKVDANNDKILGYYQLSGWKIQADMLAINGNSNVIVSAYAWSGKGMVVSLTADLSQELWRVYFDGHIKSVPLLINKDHLWVLAGNTINILLASSGALTFNKIALPYKVLTKPLAIERADGLHVVYASADYDSCLILVNEKGQVSKHLEYVIGPVHKDMSIVQVRGQEQLLLADSYGTLHHIDIETMEVSSSQKLSNLPLATPLATASGYIFVGCYDGTLFCIRDNDVVWEFKCGSVIYSKVTGSTEGAYIIACTTAGDVNKIDQETGELTWRYRSHAEIWSSAVIMNPFLAVFGARDSRLHLLSMK